MADDDTKKPDIDDDEDEKPGFSEEDDEPKTSVETVDAKKAQRESQPGPSPEEVAAQAKSGDDDDDAKASDQDDDDDDDGDGKARDSEDDEDDDDDDDGDEEEVAAKPSPARSEPPPAKKHDDHAHGAHDDHGFGHVVSIPLLAGVLGTLLVLTIVTVVASKVDLGAQLNLVVALIIATVKAGLVVTFFMHLLWDKRFNTLVFLSSIFFMVLFLSIAMTDRGEYQHLIEAREAAQAAQK
jgi:cytochrome c oxidase subunit 4